MEVRSAFAHVTQLLRAVANLGFYSLEIHLGNAMIRFSLLLDELSVKQLHEKYGHLQTVRVSRLDGGPLPPSVPSEVVHPLNHGKKAK